MGAPGGCSKRLKLPYTRVMGNDSKPYPQNLGNLSATRNNGLRIITYLPYPWLLSVYCLLISTAIWQTSNLGRTRELAPIPHLVQGISTEFQRNWVALRANPTRRACCMCFTLWGFPAFWSCRYNLSKLRMNRVSMINVVAKLRANTKSNMTISWIYQSLGVLSPIAHD